MRKFLIAAVGLVALSAPAAAQQIPEDPNADRVPEAIAAVPVDPRDREVVGAIPDSREIGEMGQAAARATEALLDVPIGPLREAIEGRRLSRREREETLGDHAAKDDPYFRERMRGQIEVASIALGAMAERIAVMTPVLRDTLEDAARRVEDAARGIPPHGYDPR